MEDSVRRTSKAHSKGCFAKKFYDLPKANLSHAEECLKCGILLIKDLCRWRRHGGLCEKSAETGGRNRLTENFGKERSYE